jgi:predicted component of type VI protein secretion system
MTWLWVGLGFVVGGLAVFLWLALARRAKTDDGLWPAEREARLKRIRELSRRNGIR